MTRYQDDDGVWHGDEDIQEIQEQTETIKRWAQEEIEKEEYMEKFFTDEGKNANIEAGGVIPKGENKIKYWPIRDADVKEHKMLVDDGKDPYYVLQYELQSAFRQASEGKGKERHATGESFEQQKIVTIGRWVAGSPAAGCLQQVIKKTAEAARLDHEAAIRELDGAIVYACAAKILLREAIDRASGEQ